MKISVNYADGRCLSRFCETTETQRLTVTKNMDISSTATVVCSVDKNLHVRWLQFSCARS